MNFLVELGNRRVIQTRREELTFHLIQHFRHTGRKPGLVWMRCHCRSQKDLMRHEAHAQGGVILVVHSVLGAYLSLQGFTSMAVVIASLVVFVAPVLIGPTGMSQHQASAKQQHN